MKLSIAIAAIVSALAVTSAPIHKREVGGVCFIPFPRLNISVSMLTSLKVLMCTGANATGTCHYEVYELKTCHQLPEPFHKNTTTFAPDGEHFACYPRTYDCGGICRSPTGCTFGAVDFNYEHKYNLEAIEWNHLIKSFDCALKKGYTNSTA